MSGLAERFFAALPDNCQVAGAGETLIAELCAEARRSWPELALDAAAFAAHLGGLVDPDDTADSLRRRHLGDLYLAAACLAGDRRALERFEVEHVGRAAAAVARVDRDPAFVDEILQRLRVKLLTGERPRLALYSGLGPLGGWLRIAASREALSRRRRANKEIPVDVDLLEILDEAETGPGSVAAELGAAVRDAFAGLPARARAVLKLYYRDGQELEAIARVYRVHPSTVSRWLSRARADIADHTYRALRERAGLTRTEADDVLGLAVDLDVSLRSLLPSVI